MAGAALPSPRLLGALAVRCRGPESRGRAPEPPAGLAVPSAAPCAACRGEDAARGWASGVGALRADLTSGRGAWVVPSVWPGCQERGHPSGKGAQGIGRAGSCAAPPSGGTKVARPGAGRPHLRFSRELR